MQARGLVTQLDGTIIARPFRKFFSVEQTEQILGPLPQEPFDVYEKVDGSLGICFFYQGSWYIATRGSFVSEQAIHAQRLFDQEYSSEGLNQNHTYLLEIIYPANRIVVDYGNMDDLVLLAAIHTETGEEKMVCDGFFPSPFPTVRYYDGVQDFNQLTNLMAEHEVQNEEGFVLRFTSGLRIKVKLDEYKRLHRLLTGVNARHIWETLSSGEPLDALLDRVPDEFYSWVAKTRDDLLHQFGKIEQAAQVVCKAVAIISNRKDQAQVILKSTYPGICFAMLDGKPYEQMIWKLIKPAAARPFREDEEG